MWRLIYCQHKVYFLFLSSITCLKVSFKTVRYGQIFQSQGPSTSTCILEAETDKLDIKRRKPGIIFISLPIGSLFKLAIQFILYYLRPNEKNQSCWDGPAWFESVLCRIKCLAQGHKAGPLVRLIRATF